MALLIIPPKLSQEEAEINITLIEEWFKQNPERDVCYTDEFDVRRNHVREDVMEHTRPLITDGVYMTEKNKKDA